MEGPIVLEELETLPSGTLGQVFAEHCHNRGINPNLVNVPLEEESDLAVEPPVSDSRYLARDDRLGQ